MLHDALKKWFGFDSFKDGQEAIITSVLNHTNTLGILPTGSGKSLMRLRGDTKLTLSSPVSHETYPPNCNVQAFQRLP